MIGGCARDFSECALCVQEEALGGYAAGVACERAVGAYHTVAWNEQTEGIRPYGLRHGAHALWAVDLLCYLCVTHSDTVGYGGERLPHLALEICAYGLQRHGETCARACEIFIKFAHGLAQHICRHFCAFGSERLLQFADFALAPVAQAERAAPRRQHQRAAWRGVMLNMNHTAAHHFFDSTKIVCRLALLIPICLCHFLQSAFYDMHHFAKFQFLLPLYFF